MATVENLMPIEFLFSSKSLKRGGCHISRHPFEREPPVRAKKLHLTLIDSLPVLKNF